MTGWNAAAALAAALALAALAAVDFPSAAFHAVNGAGRTLPDWLLANLTELGNTSVIAAVFVVFGRRHPQLFFAFVIATLAGAVAIDSLKDLFGVPRPPAVLEAGSYRLIGEAYERGSFPSGHSFATFASAAVAVGFLRGSRLRAGILLAAALIGGSRVAVGVHWPVDVCAGAVGGLLLGTLSVLLTRFLRFGYRPAAHLFMVWLALVSNMVLVISGSNYALAAPMTRAIAVVSTALVAWQYLWQGRRQATASHEADTAATT